MKDKEHTQEKIPAAIELFINQKEELERIDQQVISMDAEINSLQSLIDKSEHEISTIRQDTATKLMAAENGKARKKMRELIHIVDDAQEAIAALKQQKADLMLALNHQFDIAQRCQWHFRGLYGEYLDQLLPKLMDGQQEWIQTVAAWMNVKGKIGQGKAAESLLIETLLAQLNGLNQAEIPSVDVFNAKAIEVVEMKVTTQSMSYEQERQSSSPAQRHALKHKLAASR